MTPLMISQPLSKILNYFPCESSQNNDAKNCLWENYENQSIFQKKKKPRPSITTALQNISFQSLIVILLFRNKAMCVHVD